MPNRRHRTWSGTCWWHFIAMRQRVRLTPGNVRWNGQRRAVPPHNRWASTWLGRRKGFYAHQAGLCYLGSTSRCRDGVLADPSDESRKGEGEYREEATTEKRYSAVWGCAAVVEKMFGIDARNWVHGHIAEAQRILSKKMEVYGAAWYSEIEETSPCEDDASRRSWRKSVLILPPSWRDLEGGVPQGA